VNDYEILLMLDPETPEERHDEIIARARELIEKGGGSWLSHDPWGRRRLAYEIDHKTDGVYHLLQFDAAAETLDEVTRVLKITDGVMRHLATRRPKGGGRVAPPPQPVFEPQPEREAIAYPEPEPERESEPQPEPTAESADSQGGLEEYAEPTESEPAPKVEPEGGA
jgi:small subunit ribosomal protein S6